MSVRTDTTRSVAHGVFHCAAVTPRRAFDAFASIEAKNGGFTAPNEKWDVLERTMDFQVGSRERLNGQWKTGRVTKFDATYYDLSPGERIVHVYEMRMDGQKLSVSLATFEFKQVGAGPKLIMTEQGAFLDGYDNNGSCEGAAVKSLKSSVRI